MLSRLRGAWQVLMGERLVPFQVQAEWLLYQTAFQSQLEVMGAYLARAAKAEKKKNTEAAEALSAEPDTQPTFPVDDRKQRKIALHRRHAANGGIPQIGRSS